MDEKQILEQQIEALEKLLELRSAVITELETKVQQLTAGKQVYSYPGYYPYQGTVYGGTLQGYGGGIGGTGNLNIQCTSPNGHNFTGQPAGLQTCSHCGGVQYSSGAITTSTVAVGVGGTGSNTTHIGGTTGITYTSGTGYATSYIGHAVK